MTHRETKGTYPAAIGCKGGLQIASGEPNVLPGATSHKACSVGGSCLGVGVVRDIVDSEYALNLEVREPWMTVGRNCRRISLLDGRNPQITCNQIQMPNIARRRKVTFAPPPDSPSALSDATTTTVPIASMEEQLPIVRCGQSTDFTSCPFRKSKHSFESVGEWASVSSGPANTPHTRGT